MVTLHLGRTHNCKLGILVNEEGNGVIIPSCKFEDDSLPSESNGKYLLPLRLAEYQITEVPWRQMKRELFGSTIRSFKDKILPDILASKPVDVLEIPLSRVDTLLVGRDLPQNGDLFSKVFFLDLEHRTLPSYNFDSKKARDFETCRGSLDLYDIMEANGLGIQVRKFDTSAIFGKKTTTSSVVKKAA